MTTDPQPQTGARRTRLAIRLCIAVLAIAVLGVVAPTTTNLSSPLVPAADAQSARQPVVEDVRGYGVWTRAGQRGDVIAVSNLDDYCSWCAPIAGSLREAVDRELTDADGRVRSDQSRVIVFEVGGHIDLKRALTLNEPYIYIAGQTAPSPGISLVGDSLKIKTHDVIIQHLRFRVGDDKRGASHPEKTEAGNRDAISLSGSCGRQLQRGENVHDCPYADDSWHSVYNVVIDHASIAWAIDEGIQTWYPTIGNVVINKSIIAETLRCSIHTGRDDGRERCPDNENPHSMGLLIGDYVRRVTVTNNLFAHNDYRNPQGKVSSSSTIANNLVYNNFDHAVRLSANDSEQSIPGNPMSRPARANVVGNLYVPGPDTRSGSSLVKADSNDAAEARSIYVQGNARFNGSRFVAQSPAQSFDGVDNALAGEPLDERNNGSLTSGTWAGVLANVAQADDSLADELLRDVGARPWDRDRVDLRIVGQVEAAMDGAGNRGGVIDSADAYGEWPYRLATSRRRLVVPAEPHEDRNGDGVTNLTEWIRGFEQRDIEPDEHQVRLVVDPTSQWLRWDLTVDNQGTVPIRSIRLALDDGEFDVMPGGSGLPFDVTPDPGINSDNIRHGTVTLTAPGSGFGAGRSGTWKRGDIDRGTPAAIEVTVVFVDGRRLTGDMDLVTDTDDGDDFRSQMLFELDLG